MTTNKRVNMSDVARAANVSRPTVSLVLSGQYSTAHISQETRERVLNAARELGYRRNALAQAIKSGRSLTLGFLSLGVWTEYETLWLLGALDEAEAQGYTIKRFRLHNSSEDTATIETCIAQQLDGIIVADDNRSWATSIVNREFAASGIPLVWLDPQKPVQNGVSILPDHEGSARTAVHYLAELGHRSLAFIGWIQGIGTSVPRIKGFEQGIREVGNVKGQVRWTDWGMAHFDLEELLGQTDAPTALVCASDPLALEIIQKLGQSGRRVPEDISVVGYGDLELMDTVSPPLTTLRVPHCAMGRVAVKQVLAFVQSPELETPNEEIVFPTSLIVRGSTAKPRAAK